MAQTGFLTSKRYLIATRTRQPAPARRKRMPWKIFLRTHVEAVAAADFFSVEVLTLTGLVRYLVLFVIDLKTRRVHIGGIALLRQGGVLPSRLLRRRFV